MNHHTQLLQYLIDKHSLTRYLEVGVQNPANNFNKINCKFKIGTDPAFSKTEPLQKGLFPHESDTFFDSWGRRPGDMVCTMEQNKFDLIFLDGLHHCDQIKKDFENALELLSDKGFILIHDTLPDAEEFTTVPRETKKWFGDVYRFAIALSSYDGIKFHTLNMDCGCTVIRKSSNAKATHISEGIYSWEAFTVFKKELLNIIEPSEIEAYL